MENESIIILTKYIYDSKQGFLPIGNVVVSPSSTRFRNDQIMKKGTGNRKQVDTLSNYAHIHFLEKNKH